MNRKFWSLMKKCTVLFLALTLCMSLVPFAHATEMAETEQEIQQVNGKYYAKDIIAALENRPRATFSNDSMEQSILNEVLLPASMDIEIPHIDPSKVVQTVDVYTLDSAFAEALEEHGIYRTSMTYTEFEAIESTWLLPEEIIEVIKSMYPELEGQDLSVWTYGDFNEYRRKTDAENFRARFSEEQLQQLDSRGILISDLGTLLKEYQTIDCVLAQDNQDLKDTIKAAYQFTYEKLSAECSAARANPPSDKYTYVYFPLYNGGNGDYFLNQILTTSYWQNVQAKRALHEQQCLYNSTSTTLCCTNMYGTYSYSQGGAHEGIDFTAPSGASTPTIYAIFSGAKLSTSTYHHLAVYDANAWDEPKTFSFLHMNSITASSTVNVYGAVGTQGNQGNATGYHVHFEIHDGKTTALSPGTDHVIESITPYSLSQYIGCGDGHAYTWKYDATQHWRYCSGCRQNSAYGTHQIIGGECITCGKKFG